MKELLSKYLIKILCFIKEMFCDEKGQVSSKRVCGFTGNMCVLLCYVYSQITGKAMPTYTIEIFLTSSSLMGIDSVMKPFAKKGEDK